MAGARHAAQLIRLDDLSESTPPGTLHCRKDL
jgi:hypothetical protein